MKTFKADLHVHSCHSNKPSYWALRKFSCPESYSSPEAIYQAARRQGMDYVTITDHNTISGALQIAHLPGAFVSSEITCYFPEDGCKLHVVVLNVTEESFREILELRKNVYDLVHYLHRSGIPHFVAHPLYAQNDRLSADHLEKMLLLFTVFEVKNGARAKRYGTFLESLLDGLTREKIAALAVRHGMDPVGDRPWLKGRVGGSDDHGGLFIAGAHTAVADGGTLPGFLAAVAGRRSQAAGEDGDPLTLAHSLYAITHSFYRQRIGAGTAASMPFIKALLDRFFSDGTERASFIDRMKLFVRKNMPDVYDRGNSGNFEEILDKEAKRLLNDAGFLEKIGSESRNRKIFSVTSYLANRMIYLYTERLARINFNTGFFELVNSLSTIGLVHFLISPYYLSFHHQHRGKEIMAELEKRFSLAGEAVKKDKIALFTDTLHEINGVAITIRRLIDIARTQGVELTVITSSPNPTGYEDGVMNFRSVGDFVLPEYPDLKLHFPPILDIIDYFEREGFTRIHVSTPGTVGLLALFISRLMDIPIAGTYHTDIPQYVRSLTSDEMLENAAWQFMIWFYGRMDEVMVPSASTRKQLIERGLPEEKTRPLPRWVDVRRFTPERRDPLFWRSHTAAEGFKFIYVGRVSREKNLELLADAYMDLVDGQATLLLVIVGDGPFKKELQDKLQGYPVIFTGFLEGEALAAAYASSDVFVFPSTTDTFGNVVLEAQASGLPVIVSDEGGPKELLLDGVTGLVVKADSRDELRDAMRSLLLDPVRLAEMGANARLFTEQGDASMTDACGTILRARAANE
ncbi:MAG: glycosyltransferase [Deltaproteobacteria bacterium]|nr:glycosyltransferase [Deltaproteobacteria bacterium]